MEDRNISSDSYLPFSPNEFNNIENKIKSKYAKLIQISDIEKSRILINGIYIVSFIKNVLSAAFLFKSLAERGIKPEFGKINTHLLKLYKFYTDDRVTFSIRQKTENFTARKYIKKIVYKDYFNILQNFRVFNKDAAYIDYQSSRMQLSDFASVKLNKKPKIIDLNSIQIAESKTHKNDISEITDNLLKLLQELSVDLGLKLSKKISGNCRMIFEHHFTYCYNVSDRYNDLKLKYNIFISGALNTVNKRTFADVIRNREGEVHVLMHGHPFVHKNDTLAYLDLSLSTHFYLYSKIAAECMEQIIKDFPAPNDNSPKILYYQKTQKQVQNKRTISCVSSEDTKKIMFIGGVTRNTFQVNSYVYPNYVNAYQEYKIIDELRKRKINVIYKNRPEQREFSKADFAYFEDVKQVFTVFEKIEDLPLNILLYSTRTTLLSYLIKTDRNIIILDLENNLLCDTMKKILENRVYFISIKFDYERSEIIIDNSELELALKDYKTKRSHWLKISNEFI